jgi:hypothetical protein
MVAVVFLMVMLENIDNQYIVMNLVVVFLALYLLVEVL